MGAWAGLFFAAFCSAIGSCVLKVAGRSLVRMGLAGGAYLVGLGAYFHTLSLWPLSLAYPALIGANLVLVGLASILFLGERLSGRQAAGYLMILAALVLVAQAVPTGAGGPA